MIIMTMVQINTILATDLNKSSKSTLELFLSWVHCNNKFASIERTIIKKLKLLEVKK